MATAPSPSAREPFSTGAAVSVSHVSATDAGLLLLRLIVGVVFLYHGSAKLFGGLHPFVDVLAGLGVPLPWVGATLSACTEFFGGAAMLLGFAVRLAAVPMVFNMLVAILLVHGRAFDLRHGGMEYPLTLAVILLALGIMGGGRLSLSGLLNCCPQRADVHGPR